MNTSSSFLAGRSELMRALAAHRGALVRVGLVSLLVNLLMLTPTLYMLQVYDRVVVSRNELTLLAVSLIALLLFVVIAVAEALRSRLLVKASAVIEASLGRRVFGAGFEASLDPLSGDGSRPPAPPAGCRTAARRPPGRGAAQTAPGCRSGSTVRRRRQTRPGR